MTYDTHGVWRCYEIKISKSDFHSKAKNTFIGNFNYYVMPNELYEQVKDEIPSNIGVYIGGSCEKRSKHQELKVDEQILKDSMIRSLYREADKQMRSNDLILIESISRQLNIAKKNSDCYMRKYHELTNNIREKYGREILKELELI